MACLNNFLIVCKYTENGIVILNQKDVKSEQLNVINHINQVELDLDKDMNMYINKDVYLYYIYGCG